MLAYINTANLGWDQRRFDHPLLVIKKSHLKARSVAARRRFLPQEAKGFQLLLIMMLNLGADLSVSGVSIVSPRSGEQTEGMPNSVGNASRSPASSLRKPRY